MAVDIINALFEMGGAIFLAMNVVRLHRDKVVRGVHWAATAFFTVWGYWNLFYYEHIGHIYSRVAGFAVVATNTVWLSQMIFYIAKERAFTARYAKPESMR